MAALSAAGRGRPVVLVERTADGGRKILISGGGRCNVLPRAIEPQRFVSDSGAPLVRRLLRSWPLDAQRAFFERDLGVPLALDDDTGKYFPVSNRAHDVRDALVSHARDAGVDLRFGAAVTGLVPEASGWTIHTSRGHIAAARVVLATGGRSVPSTGSDGLGLDLLASLGHTVHPTYPALTPLTADPPVHARLSGVSLSVRVRAASARGSAEAHGGFLFTHRGYSGPAVLDVSHVAVRALMDHAPAVIRVRWTPHDAASWTRLLRTSSGLVLTVVSRELPARLAERLMEEAGVARDRRAADLRRAERAAIVDRLTAYELPWTGHEGYRKAEVTGGGVALREVDPRTLESRVRPGLFLCGELLDAFGPIGGHNFAWAWATGWLAGFGASAPGPAYATAPDESPTA